MGVEWVSGDSHPSSNRFLSLEKNCWVSIHEERQVCGINDQDYSVLFANVTLNIGLYRGTEGLLYHFLRSDDFTVRGGWDPSGIGGG